MRDAHLKRGHVVLLHAQRRNLGDLAVEDAVAEAFHLDARRLAHVNVRDVGLVHLALHIDLVHVALGHDQRGRRTQHQDGAHRIAHLHVARKNHAIHRRHDGGVAELLFELLQAGLALQHLRPRLFQLGRVHADLRLRRIAPGQRRQVVLLASSSACRLTMPSFCIADCGPSVALYMGRSGAAAFTLSCSMLAS